MASMNQPGLASTEFVETNELDSLSREEILGRIKAILEADPSLLQELIALNARQQTMTRSALVVDPEKATRQS